MKPKSIARREAAKMLGVPAAFLKQLEKEGLYEVPRDEKRRPLYSREFAEQIRPAVTERWAMANQGAPPPSPPPPPVPSQIQVAASPPPPMAPPPPTPSPVSQTDPIDPAVQEATAELFGVLARIAASRSMTIEATVREALLNSHSAPEGTFYPLVTLSHAHGIPLADSWRIFLEALAERMGIQPQPQMSPPYTLPPSIPSPMARPPVPSPYPSPSPSYPLPSATYQPYRPQYPPYGYQPYQPPVPHHDPVADARARLEIERVERERRQLADQIRHEEQARRLAAETEAETRARLEREKHLANQQAEEDRQRRAALEVVDRQALHQRRLLEQETARDREVAARTREELQHQLAADVAQLVAQLPAEMNSSERNAVHQQVLQVVQGQPPQVAINLARSIVDSASAPYHARARSEQLARDVHATVMSSGEHLALGAEATHAAEQAVRQFLSTVEVTDSNYSTILADARRARDTAVKPFADANAAEVERERQERERAFRAEQEAREAEDQAWWHQHRIDQLVEGHRMPMMARVTLELSARFDDQVPMFTEMKVIDAAFERAKAEAMQLDRDLDDGALRVQIEAIVNRAVDVELGKLPTTAA